MKWDDITPSGDRVLIEVFSTETKTAGGIYLPETAAGVHGRFKRGTVKATGPDAEGLQAGDEVLYRAHVEKSDEVLKGFILLRAGQCEAKVVSQ